MIEKVNVFWFRRDLRLNDNVALYHALCFKFPVLPIFIFDTNILCELEDKNDKRVSFIYQNLISIQKQLEASGSSLEIFHSTPLEAFEKIVDGYEVEAVFTNHDYEPYARQRDDLIEKFLSKKNIAFKSFKDQVIFEKSEVVKENGEPYQVFTPYSKKWKSILDQTDLQPFASEKLVKNFLQKKPQRFPSLKEIGFDNTTDFPKLPVDETIIKHYDQTRNTPSIRGTSHLGIHLRFGTISIRELVAKALALNEIFLNELIWREFFMQLLWHYPRLVNEACKREYDNIKWRNNDKEFEAWCVGKTGYPIVDAGMRELNETGFMHNRVRMITASFLVKHLLVDWRWGEAYFAKKLLDYELSSNNGNWQWVAGCGCDAAPYFRIFNPQTQTKKFDPDLKYIRKWIPELESFSYAKPIVDQQAARQRCLEAYKLALKRSV